MDWAADPSWIDAWLDTPTLRDRMHLTPTDGFTYVAMNVALPPLDDVAVRRAIGQVVDREALLPLLDRGGFTNRVYTHAALDSLEDNLLLTYRPSGVSPMGDVAAARASMAESRYDTDDDGRCDGVSCSGIVLWVPEGTPERDGAARLMAAQLAPIGLEVQVRNFPNDGSVNPADHQQMVMGTWAKDFPSASTFLPVLFGGDQIQGGFNPSMLGASARMLRRDGYDVRTVPSVDDRIAECEQQVFQAQVRCWAEFDQYLSEEVVPIVPLAQTFQGWATSERVRGFSVDAAIASPMPSIGAMWVEGEAPVPATAVPQPVPPPGMPDGLYRTEVTEEDFRAVGGDFPEDFVASLTGVHTITLDDGWFEVHSTSEEHVIWDPIQIGTYEGSGSGVRFHTRAPFDATTPVLRWTVDGDALRFQEPSCGPQTGELDCAYLRLLFAEHPWSFVRAI